MTSQNGLPILAILQAAWPGTLQVEAAGVKNSDGNSFILVKCFPACTVLRTSSVREKLDE